MLHGMSDKSGFGEFTLNLEEFFGITKRDRLILQMGKFPKIIRVTQQGRSTGDQKSDCEDFGKAHETTTGSLFLQKRKAPHQRRTPQYPIIIEQVENGNNTSRFLVEKSKTSIFCAKNEEKLATEGTEKHGKGEMERGIHFPSIFRLLLHKFSVKFRVFRGYISSGIKNIL